MKKKILIGLFIFCLIFFIILFFPIINGLRQASLIKTEMYKKIDENRTLKNNILDSNTRINGNRLVDVFYKKNGELYCFDRYKIENVEIKNFKFIKEGYAIYENKLYYCDYSGVKIIQDVKFENLKIDPMIAKNNKNVYYYGEKIDLNPETLERIVVSCKIYLKDDKHIYIGNKKIENADPKTFKILGGCYSKYSMDKRNIYYYNKKINYLPSILYGKIFEIIAKGY